MLYSGGPSTEGEPVLTVLHQTLHQHSTTPTPQLQCQLQCQLAGAHIRPIRQLSVPLSPHMAGAPVVINPFKVIISGTIAALVTIPGMVFAAWLFTPIRFVRLAARLVRLVLCCPCNAVLASRALGNACCPPPRGALGDRASSAPGSQRGGRGDKRRSTKVAPITPVEFVAEAAAIELRHGYGHHGGGEGGRIGAGRTGGAVAGSRTNKVAPVAAGSHAPAVGPAWLVRELSAVLSDGGLAVGDDGPRTSTQDGRSPAECGASGLTERQEEEAIDEQIRSVPTTRRAEALDEASRAMGDGRVAAADRRFCYTSLDEHMLALSLRRSLEARDWPNACHIALGWALSWVLLLGLLFVFSVYGCEFYSTFSEEANGDMLMLSWLWSVGQRFLINEPCLICFSKGLPMLFASEFCANVCGETCNTCLAVFVEAIVAFVRAVKSGGA